MTPPRGPALRYFGGKWRLAPWIISHFPEHDCYVEPFAGAGSVLLQKAPSRFEYYNDADSRVVNFFRVLRDRRCELKHVLSLTPFARAELKLSEVVADDPLEDARRFYVRMWQGRGGHEASTGWRYQRAPARNKTALRDFVDTSHIEAIALRLRQVAIECDDAFSVLRRYDAPGTLFYVDPPYLAATRSKSSGRYREELKTEDEHRLLLSLLRELSGYVVVSHPICALYSQLLEGWERSSRCHLAQGNAGKAAKRYKETIWLNPRCADAQMQRTLALGPVKGFA